jgi:hypothetical protein
MPHYFGVVSAFLCLVAVYMVMYPKKHCTYAIVIHPEGFVASYVQPIPAAPYRTNTPALEEHLEPLKPTV